MSGVIVVAISELTCPAHVESPRIKNTVQVLATLHTALCPPTAEHETKASSDQHTEHSTNLVPAKTIDDIDQLCIHDKG